jgi:hypothetical protein
VHRARTIVVAAALLVASASEPPAQPTRDVHYYTIDLINANIANVTFAGAITRALSAGGLKPPPSDLGAMVDEATSALKALLGGKKGTAKAVACLPPDRKVCVEIICQSCVAE